MGDWLREVVFGLNDGLVKTLGLTALVPLALGTLKARYTLKGPLRSGLEFLGVVTAGTLAGVLLGALLHAI